MNQFAITLILVIISFMLGAFLTARIIYLETVRTAFGLLQMLLKHLKMRKPPSGRKTPYYLSSHENDKDNYDE